jgi:hypothetical protein
MCDFLQNHLLTHLNPTLFAHRVSFVSIISIVSVASIVNMDDDDDDAAASLPQPNPEPPNALLPPPERLFSTFKALLAFVNTFAKRQGHAVVKRRPSNYRDGSPRRYDL